MVKPEDELVESRFTPARPDCPHPERWHSTDEDSTEIEVSVLVGAFIYALQPDFCIETGTAWGQTAEFIGIALQDNGQGHLLTFEPHPSRVAFSRNRCKDLPVTVAQMESQDGAQMIAGTRIDFAWFDSLIDLRIKEFHYFKRWMHQGTVIGFHDTGPQHNLAPGIKQLAELGHIAPIFLPTPRGVCFARVL